LSGGAGLVIYILSKLFWAIAQPVNFIVLLVLAWAALTRLGYRRAGLRVLQTALGLLVTVTVLPVGQMLLIPLENRFTRPDPFPDAVAGIIVLGGAIDSDISAARGFPVFDRGGQRMDEALALARRYPNAKILFTGGSSDIVGPKIREAVYAGRFLANHGIPAGRLLVEDASRNTWENAENSFKLVKPKPEENWLLVTSAFHMPRAMGIFRRLGWRVIPDPVDYRTEGRLDIRGFTLIHRLSELDVALKEWIGLVAYSVLGRTDSLFPAPSS
jgi:uncharacterized SAM-binding protein YcdF (DUF218 family)